MTAADSPQTLMEVIAAHVYMPSLLRGISQCSCGLKLHGMPHNHLAHVAEQVRAHLAPLGALADEWEQLAGELDEIGEANGEHRAFVLITRAKRDRNRLHAKRLRAVLAATLGES